MIPSTIVLRPLLLLDLAMKAVLVSLLALAVLWPQLPQLEGDGYAAWRALIYPISLVVVPLSWAVFGRPRAEPFPYGVDLLVPLPLVIDVAAPRLYHTVDWWDKFMHGVSWSVLGSVSVLVLSWFRPSRALAGGLALGIALLTALLWELWEYLVWVRPSPELLETEYSDTVGDLGCDLAASALAVTLTLLVILRRDHGASTGLGNGRPMRSELTGS
jgi:hypothetical protein